MYVMLTVGFSTDYSWHSPHALAMLLDTLIFKKFSLLIKVLHMCSC